ncbi:MAG: DUF1559 domain-containing protein [Armatimonadetes bacterium]|nr:DUF1559 domain-containing protein [Armatimonadota bacterium]
MKRRGFTLIEMLVVVAILGILAALLMPVLVGVRAKGRQTTCISNQKQIGAAFIMYQETWDDLFPAYRRNRLPAGSSGGCGSSCHWSPPLEPFLKNPLLNARKNSETVFLCPSAENTQMNSYAMNLNLGDTFLRPGQTRPERRVETSGVILADVKSPAQTVLIYDTPVPDDSGRREPDFWGARWAYWKEAQPGELAEVRTIPSTGNSRAIMPQFPRHGGGNVVSFVDGHVRWLTNLSRYVGVDSGSRRSGTEGFRIN